MRIVVTGAGGFLGRRVVARLAEMRREVIAVDIVPPQAEMPGVTYVTSDLHDPAPIVADPARDGGFCLVHLAWNLKRDPAQFREQAEHVSLLAGLLDAWCGKGLKQAIIMGSAEEYGMREGRLSESDDSVSTLTPYGWAKNSARMLAKLKCEASNTNLLWLRPFIIYGPGQGGDMAIPYAVRQAATRQAADFSDGLQKRDFVFADDVAEAVIAGCEKQPEGRHVVNVGTGQPVTLRDVLAQIANELDATSLFRFGARPRRAGEPAIQVADVSKANSLLGWAARTSWRDGIRKTCDAARTR